MSDDKQADIAALTALLSDSAIREIWQQELWAVYANEGVRKRFTADTGIDLNRQYDDPFDAVSDEAFEQIDADVVAFMKWFNQRVWPSFDDNEAE